LARNGDATHAAGIFDINMDHPTWEAIRAYAPTIFVTILALLGLLKDAPDSIDRIEGVFRHSPISISQKSLAKRSVVWVLLVFTLLVAAFGIRRAANMPAGFAWVP
jgi:hypothetical protein